MRSIIQFNYLILYAGINFILVVPGLRTLPSILRDRNSYSDPQTKQNGPHVPKVL
jgi:hypothetical protein